jgi:uncharacterized protein (TIGR03437 family)
MNSFRMYFLVLVTLCLICTPAAAQITADTGEAIITYTGSSGANTAAVHISNATGPISATINPNLSSDGTATASSDPTIAIFTFNIVDTTINIGTNSVALATLARKGANTYSKIAKLFVSATGCNACLTIPLTLTITGGGQLTVQYNGVAIPNNGVQIFASPGGTTTFNLTLTSTTGVGYSITTNQSWLNVISGNQSGSLAPGTPVTVTFQANGTFLSGTNNGIITINSNGAVAASVPVVFNVGTGGGLTLSPNPLNFQYITSTGSFVPGQTQFVTVTGPASGATYTASSNQNWLLVNGSQSVSGVSVLSQLQVSVNPAIVLPFTGTLSGAVRVDSSDGFTANLNVNLTISTTSTGGGTPNQLTFSVTAPGAAAPPAQTIQLFGTGSFSATAIETTGTSVVWLSVTPTNGTLSSTGTPLTVSVNPSGLGAGTYTGSIFISASSLLQNGSNTMTVSVTLNIGGSGVSGAVASPTSLVLNVPSGGTQSQSFIVNGDGTNFSIQSFAPGITVSPTSGLTPNIVTVTATNATTSTSGTLVVSSSLGTQNVNVQVNVLAGNVLSSNPASLTYINPSAATLNTNLSISASGDPTNTLAFSVSSAPSFVTYTPNSLTTPTVIGIRINTSALGPGFNTGNLVLASNSAANNTLIIPITVLSPGSTPGFSVSPTSVSLNAQAFGPPVTTTVQLSGLSGTNFTASQISSGNWLQVTPSSGTSPATLTLTANPQVLGVGTYTGTITVTGNNGATLTFTVTLNTTSTGPATPVLSVGTNTLNFNYKKGDPAPTALPVQITASGVAVSFTATASANWISLSQTTGSTPSTLNVTLNTAQLSEGTQNGTITITAAGAANSPQTIQVTANVSAPPVLSLSASSANFSYRTGDPNPAPQTVQLSSSGAALSFTISVSNAPWLTVTPTSGTTPANVTLSVNPANLAVGQYSATISINSSGGTPTIGVVLTVSAPLPTIAQIHNGASNQPGPIAPGLIIVLTGTGMGPDKLVTYTLNGNRFATVLSSTRVLIGGIESPMIYTSATQVAAVVPYAMAGRATATVQVEYLAQRSNAITAQVTATAPAVFTLNASGTGPGAILNQDYSVNSDANPANVGSIIQVFATGEGQTLPPGIDGKLADDPAALPKPVQPVSATISDIPAEVTYFGAAPGLVAGVIQVNVRVPPGAGSGEVILTMGGNKSPRGVTVSIQ